MFAQRLKTNPDNLVKLFAVTSFFVICIISALFGWLFFHFLNAHLLKQDAEVSMAFVQSIARVHSPESYFLNQATSNADANMERFFQHIAQMPDVIRANAYSTSESILWSSTPALTGKEFHDNIELTTALSGQLVSHWEEVDDITKAEHTNFPAGVTAFVENYIPIWNDKQTQVLGVLEIYKVPTAMLNVIAQGHWLFILIAMLSGILLYAALYWIIHYATTWIKQQQRALAEVEKLAVLGELASVVSHSLRGPLSSIRATAELAHLEAQDVDPTVQAYMNDIMAEADRLNLRVRELLSSIHAPEEPLVQVDIGDIINTSIVQCKACLERTLVRVVRDIPHNLPAVRANPEFLKHVLINLISNALEAMPQGGTLTIKAERFANMVTVRLMDTGVGMSESQLMEVFRPLYSNKSEGVGVGLVLARRIMHRYGGKLDLFSPGEGNGTTALLQIPAVE